MLDILAENSSFDNVQYSLYGDGSYVLRPFLVAGLKRGHALTEQEEFDESRMSMAGAAAEWQFGKMLQTWPRVDFNENLRLFWRPVGHLYAVAALLTNVHTCLYGSATAGHFNCRPPTVAEYLCYTVPPAATD